MKGYLPLNLLLVYFATRIVAFCPEYKYIC